MSTKEKQIKFKIINMQVSEDLEWQMKIKAVFGLSEAKAFCKVEINVDEEYYDRKVKEIETRKQEVEARPDMFENFRNVVKEMNNQIADLLAEKGNMIELQVEEFDASVLQADFSKDTLILQVPEEKIHDVIKIRKITERFTINVK